MVQHSVMDTISQKAQAQPPGVPGPEHDLVRRAAFRVEFYSPMSSPLSKVVRTGSTRGSSATLFILALVLVLAAVGGGYSAWKIFSPRPAPPPPAQDSIPDLYTEKVEDEPELPVFELSEDDRGTARTPVTTDGASQLAPIHPVPGPEKMPSVSAGEQIESRPEPVLAPRPVIESSNDWMQGLEPLGANDFGYQEFKNSKDGSVLILVPAGQFEMGSLEGTKDEQPVRQAHLAPYLIGKHEVTWEQFDRYLQSIGKGPASRPDWVDSGSYPARMSWEDARDYSKWAGLRLPTEAEWERAARGTDGRRFPWGDDLLDSGDGCWANYSDLKCSKKDGFEKTAPVGSYAKGVSPVGALDMAGNVSEACSDWYDSSYYSQAAAAGDRDPKGPATGRWRVIRGGSWNTDPMWQRSAKRYFLKPDRRHVGQGCRVARSAS